MKPDAVFLLLTATFFSFAPCKAAANPPPPPPEAFGGAAEGGGGAGGAPGAGGAGGAAGAGGAGGAAGAAGADGGPGGTGGWEGIWGGMWGCICCGSLYCGGAGKNNEIKISLGHNPLSRVLNIVTLHNIIFAWALQMKQSQCMKINS